MKISYAITVCNEIEEIKKLIPFLLKHKRDEDEIVVQQDEISKGDNKVLKVQNYLNDLIFSSKIKFVSKPLNNNFSEFKNNLNLHCTGDFIFQIDADEILTEQFITNLHSILENNKDIEAYYVNRINTIEGITREHIQRWGWNINSYGHINWPDKQLRIYKNSPDIKWEGKVHETIKGYKTISQFPDDLSWALNHPKTIERQEKQNEYYDTL